MELLSWLPLFPLLQCACALPGGSTGTASPLPPYCDELNKVRLYMQLQEIDYHSYWTYSTPAHLAVSEGFVNFNIVNNLIQAPIKCSAEGTVPFGFFYGDKSYNCDVSAIPADFSASATFTFSSTDGTFGLNATWICYDSHLQKP
jgi:hypothetical protein